MELIYLLQLLRGSLAIEAEFSDYYAKDGSFALLNKGQMGYFFVIVTSCICLILICMVFDLAKLF